MNLEAAILAAAPEAPDTAIQGLLALLPRITMQGAIDTPLRAAHLIGQCAHESTGFTRLVESLFYRSGDRIFAVFGKKYFASAAHAEYFARNQEKLADHVYANRMGNGGTASGDGFRYRGRGYLQLTGRGNYRIFGRRVGIDLVADPERAAEPGPAWLIAASYLASRSRAGKTALQWADHDNVEMVTRIVNGGLNGLTDRQVRTATALTALGAAATEPPLARGAEGLEVRRLQFALATRGLSPGAIDGDFGGTTEKALRDFQASAGLLATGEANAATWKALKA